MEKTYTGVIEKGFGDDVDVIYLKGFEDDDPLLEIIMNDVESYGNLLSVVYYISDTEKTKAELDESIIRQIIGDVTVDYQAHYSEITGYLWTDQELNIGGHDLLDELDSNVGKYLHMEIKFNKGDDNDVRDTVS